MLRLTPVQTMSDYLAGFFAPLFTQSEPAMRRIPIYVSENDVPQRLSSRRRKSRVTVQIYGV